MLWWNIRRLRSSDAAVRRSAAEALGGTKDNRAAEALVEALLSDCRSQRDITIALAKMGTIAVEALLIALADRREDVRFKAARALGEIGWQPSDPAQRSALAVAARNWNDAAREGPHAVEFLMNAFRETAHVKLGLGLMGMQDSAARHEAARRALVQIGSGAVDPLIAALQDRSYDVRKAAAKALGEIRDPRAVQPLMVAIKSGDNTSGDNAEQSAAMNALVEIGSAAVEPLLAALKGRFHMARRAAVTLGRIKDPRAVEPLIAILINDSSMRGWAAQALAQIGSAAAEPLAAILDDESRRQTPDWATKLVAQTGSAADKLKLEIEDFVSGGATNSATREVRAMAVKALREMNWQPSSASHRSFLAVAERNWEAAIREGPAAVRPLMDALATGASGAAKALGELKESRAVSSLIAALASENESLRAAAVQALGQIGPAASSPLVAALVERSTWELHEHRSWIQRDRFLEALDEALLQTGTAAIAPVVAALRDTRGWSDDVPGYPGQKTTRRRYHLLEIATKVLVRCGSANAESLVTALRSVDEVERAAVAQMLRGIGAWG